MIKDEFDNKKKEDGETYDITFKFNDGNYGIIEKTEFIKEGNDKLIIEGTSKPLVSSLKSEATRRRGTAKTVENLEISLETQDSVHCCNFQQWESLCLSDCWELHRSRRLPVIFHSLIDCEHGISK